MQKLRAGTEARSDPIQRTGTVYPSEDGTSKLVEHRYDSLPYPDESGRRKLYIYVSSEIVLVYHETARKDARPNGWGHMDQKAEEFWQELVH